jgi:hypothetical protein
VKKLRKISAKAASTLIVLALAFLCVSSARVLTREIPAAPTPEPTLYERCVEGTIVPALLLRAIARAESDECDWAIGDGGMSIGRFQLCEVYHAARSRAWGMYSPTIPEQAGRIAALYLQDCLRAFPGDEARGIAAYRQGVYGVKRDGPTLWYVERVRARI